MYVSPDWYNIDLFFYKNDQFTLRNALNFIIRRDKILKQSNNNDNKLQGQPVKAGIV